MVASEVPGGSSAVATSALLTPWPTRPSRLRSYVNLTRELAVTSFKLKYAGSILGYVWSLIKPLMVFGMLYLIFALFLLRGRTTAQENFPVELLVGIVIWTFFADATVSSLAAIVSNGDMIRKAYFARWILVIASNLSAAMTLGVNAALVLVLGLVFNWYHLGWHSLLAVPLLLELYLLTLGIGLILAAVFVYYRDLGHIWEIVLQMIFYSSAIVFPFALIPGGLQVFAAMNPIAQIIEDMRRALVTSSIPWTSDLLGVRMIVPSGIVLVTLVVGATAFRRLSLRFGERL